MKQLYFSLFTLFISTTLFSQEMFQRTYGGNNAENITALHQTSDGGYAMAGFTVSFGPGTAGAMLIKTDINGDTLWAKSYGHAFDEECFTVRETYDKGYILTGYSESSNGGDWDAYLIKTDSVGDTLWTRMYGGNGSEVGAFCRQLSDSGFVVVGYTNSFGAGSYDAYIMRTDKVGDTLWARAIGGTGFFDYYNAVIPAIGGGFIAVGGAEDFGPGSTDAFITKFDDNGDTLWSRIYGLSNFEDATSIVITQDSMYLVSGTTNSAGVGGNEAWVMKIDQNGNVIWHNGFGGTGDDRTYHLSNTVNNGAIVAGYTTSFGAGGVDVLGFETDSLGALVWAKTYGGSDDDWANRAYPTDDNGYVFGAIGENLGQQLNDFYLIKTDSAGNSGCNQQTAPNVQTTAFNFTTAKITPEVNVGMEVFNNPFTVINPAVIPDTLCFNCGVIPTAGFESSATGPTVSFVDTSDNATSWLWDFGDGNTSNLQNPIHSYDNKDSTYYACLYATNHCGTDTVCDSIIVFAIGINELTFRNGATVYPNPNNGQFVLQFKAKDAKGGTVHLFDIKGRTVFTNNIPVVNNGDRMKIDLSSFTAGIYYIRYNGTAFSWQEKIIIQ